MLLKLAADSSSGLDIKHVDVLLIGPDEAFLLYLLRPMRNHWLGLK